VETWKNDVSTLSTHRLDQTDGSGDEEKAQYLADVVHVTSHT
jgi:hypothetical protein